MEKLQNGQMIEWDDLDKRRYYVIGPSLFLFVRAFIYPFTFIKTRLFMQQQNSIYNGTFDAFRKVIKYEGMLGLYRGFNVSILGLAAGQMYITTYELTRSQLTGYSTEVKGLIAGAVATCVGQTVTVPIDVLTQHLMMDGQVTTATTRLRARYVVVKNTDYVIPEQKVRLRSGLTIARDMFQREGLRGFYRGYGVSLLTYAPNSALWWSIYGGTFRLNIEHGVTELFPVPVIQAYCGVVSAVVASILTNPLDVIRTRYQVGVSACCHDDDVLHIFAMVTYMSGFYLG